MVIVIASIKSSHGTPLTTGYSWNKVKKNDR